MDRVVRRWTQKLASSRHRDLEILGRGDKRKLVETIRGDFHLVPSLRATADTVERELVRLTDEQCQLFARLSANPRVIARGAAGTGKTLIAAEEVRRLASDGSSVLYTCYSRNLAHQVSRALEGVAGVQVRTLHSLMVEVVRRAGRFDELPDVDEDDLMSLFLPELALDVLLDGRAPLYDVVLIDEGQDLLRPEYLDLIEALVGGDLSTGKWRIFIDPNQNIFGGIATGGLERLQRSGPVEWPLTVNCRNTSPIATQVALMSGVPLTSVLAPDGPSVEMEWYNSYGSQLEAVNRRLDQLTREGFSPSRIVLLSRYRLSKSVAGAGPESPVHDISRGAGTAGPGTLTFSTVSSFKGLESDVVLLLDVDDLQSSEGLASVYVGASRARVALLVFLSVTQRDRFRALARQFGSTFGRATSG
jgi:superfamily I DNA/RNA helicase